MTAKEIAEECYSSSMGMYVFDDEDLQEYVDQLCKEQRDLCIKRWVKAPSGKLKEYLAIRNAPQPEGL